MTSTPATPSACTAITWTAQHAFESDPIELDPEGYDEYERCEKPADDPIHFVALDETHRSHFDPEFGTPPPCGDAEPWEAKTTDRDAVTCHMCTAHLDSRALLAPQSVTDDRGWASYSRTLPRPTAEQYAAVVLEFCDSPYAAARQRAAEGFRNAARMVWRQRHAGSLNGFTERVARGMLHGFAAKVRAYDGLTLAWAQAQAEKAFPKAGA